MPLRSISYQTPMVEEYGSFNTRELLYMTVFYMLESLYPFTIDFRTIVTHFKIGPSTLSLSRPCYKSLTGVYLYLIIKMLT